MLFLTVIPEFSIWDLLSVIGLDDFDHHSPIWVFFSESESGLVRVEFRSKGVPVQPTAVKFGGGGHVQAAGCRLDTLEDYKYVIDDLDKVLGEHLQCLKKN